MRKKKTSKVALRATFRLTQPNTAFLEKAIKEGRHASMSAYINNLLDKQRHEEDAFSLEERIVATLNAFRTTIRHDLKVLHQTTQTTGGLLHALSKMLIVVLPEADPDLRKLSEATAQNRYKKLLIQAGRELMEARTRADDSEEGTETGRANS